MQKVNAKEYTKKYFLTGCEGGKEWQESAGLKLTPRMKYAVDLVRLKKGMMVLDFGCGRGETVIYVAKKGASVFAVDYSKTAINLCKQSIKKLPKSVRTKIKLLQKNVEGLKLKNNSLDIIFFLDVFEHLTNKELEIILKKFFDYLKSGGKLVIHTAPNTKFYNVGYLLYTRWANKIVNPLWRIFFKEELLTNKDPRAENDKIMHINEQTKESVEKLLERTGFKSRVWLDSKFHKIRLRDKINYLFLTPIWLPILKDYFTRDIWAIGEKMENIP